jgi:hypothetical protein
VTGTAGLTLALCRRVRAAFWAGVGVTCLIVMNRAELGKQNRGDVLCLTEEAVQQLAHED